MLFKYPQLLWSLWLLLIPVLIHLLQLRRFKTTPFTNVRLLKKVQARSQKSQTLKKWLLLFTRMALFTALILAFAQPFTAEKTAFKEQELVIYLDNSFSMQARTEQGSLLEAAVQELINALPAEATFSLFTNNAEFREVTVDEIRNPLLQMGYSPDQLSLSELGLKGSTYFSQDPDALRRFVLVSDFQERMAGDLQNASENTEIYLVPRRTGDLLNISIDSVFLDTETRTENNLRIRVSGNSDFGSIPVSLFDEDELIAKSSVAYSADQHSELVFTLPPGESIEGRVSLNDRGLAYDNELYFNINTREKIQILGIGTGGGFLSRLYGDERTEYRAVASVDEAIPLLPDYDLVILNALQTLPATAAEALLEFTDLGGNLLLIPASDMQAGDFNRLLSPFGISLGRKNSIPLDVTDINYAHPLFEDVFRERVDNFQYPGVQEYFTLNGNADRILGYSNGEPFLAQNGSVYIFTSSLDPQSSNFISSPLVVPTFYSMALRSRSLPDLYYLLGTEKPVDVPVQLGEDRILSLSNGKDEFIPRQQAIGRKTRLWFYGNPEQEGTFTLLNAPVDRAFSFNFSREESDLSFLDTNSFNENVKVTDSVAELLEEFEKGRAVTGLWKWFVILALLFLLTEVIIQKVLK